MSSRGKVAKKKLQTVAAAAAAADKQPTTRDRRTLPKSKLGRGPLLQQHQHPVPP